MLILERAGFESVLDFDFAREPAVTARTIVSAAPIFTKTLLGFDIFLMLQFSTNFGFWARPASSEVAEGLSSSWGFWSRLLTTDRFVTSSGVLSRTILRYRSNDRSCTGRESFRYPITRNDEAKGRWDLCQKPDRKGGQDSGYSTVEE